MNNDRQRAERIAKNLLANCAMRYAQAYGQEAIDSILAAATRSMEYEIAEVRREAIEECALKWINVLDRLPDDGVTVLAAMVRVNGELVVRLSHWSEYGWYTEDQSYCKQPTVIYWQSLPSVDAIRALLPAAQKEETP